MLTLIVFLVFGLVVGALARLVAPGRESGGWVSSMLLGVVGSLLGGMLGRAVGGYHEGEAAGFIVSLVTSIMLVGAYLAFRSRAVHAAAPSTHERR